MYLHGLGECNPVWEDCVSDGPVNYDVTQWPGNETPSSSSFTWLSDILKTGAQVYGQVTTLETQADIAKSQAQAQATQMRYQSLYPSAYKNTGSFPGVSSGGAFSSNMMNYLMVGGLSIAALMMLNGKK